MSKWVAGVAVAAAAGLAVAIPTFAGADGQRECSLNLTVRAARTRIFSGQPPASGRDESAGTVDGTICGRPFHGALRERNTYPNPPGFTINTLTFGPVGSFRAIGAGTAKLNPDSSISLSGRQRITNGTGIYEDASGSTRFTGKVASGSNVAIFHFTGEIEY